MPRAFTPGRLERLLLLAVPGAFLTIVGWYRWANP